MESEGEKMNEPDLKTMLTLLGNAQESLARIDQERADLRRWFEQRHVTGACAPDTMTMRDMADHAYERQVERAEQAERAVVAAEKERDEARAACAKMRELLERCQVALKGNDNLHSAIGYHLYATECGKELLKRVAALEAQAQEAADLLQNYGLSWGDMGWHDRRYAWMANHTARMEEK